MADTETELIGVTLPKIWVQRIDTAIKNDPMVNRQDFIRDAIKSKLEVTP
jgi:metal-responsive CopG/Arc/MetJ family transcriptional regulator